MSADVLDYGGRYEMSKKTLEDVGQQARDRVAKFLKEGNSSLRLQDDEAGERKDEAWTVIQLGMCFYRSGEKYYDESLKCFENAREALLRVEARGHKCNGSLARVWYCVGLVHRQRGRDTLAREAFSNCVAHGWKGIEERAREGKSTGSFDYHIGKCFGLGRAWLSYNEASLATAHDYVVAARRLLHEVDPQKEKVRFIHAYIEIVHAVVIMSRCSEPDQLDDAIRILTLSYEALGGDAALTRPRNGHGPYALRALVELARGYLQRALSSTLERPEEKKGHLKTALDLVYKVKTSAAANKDIRNHCNAFIVESRIYRAQDHDAEALQSAQRAMEIGGSGEFTRIDCWTTLGEAKYWCGDYEGAVDAFRHALKFGLRNRKIFAVCHLHLANAYLKLDRSKAREHYSTWDTTRRGMENAFIRGLEERVRVSLGEFSVTADQIADQLAAEEKKIIDDHVKSLQKWITEITLAKVEGDYKEAERLLEKDKKTLKGYLKHEGPPTKAGEE